MKMIKPSDKTCFVVKEYSIDTIKDSFEINPLIKVPGQDK